MKDILALYSELYELAKLQRQALLNGRLNDALTALKRRGEIEAAIDAETRKYGENIASKEEFSGKILSIIEKILALDSETKTILSTEIEGIKGKISEIKRAKSFLKSVSSPKKPAKSLDISI